jgi:tetratricopeptide (TPR) repeat protein
MRLFRSVVLAMVVGAAPLPVAAAAQQPAAPGDPQYLYLLGRHFESLGRIDEAIAAHKRAIELDPQSAILHVELADLYARQNKPLDAVTEAEAALALEPSSVDANRILGMIYAEYADRNLAIRPGDNPSKYLPLAIAALEKARGDVPDIGVDIVLGQLYLQTGAFAKAIPPLRRVVDSQPDSIDAVVLLSTAAESAGQPDEAVRVLEAFLRRNPESYRAQIRIAEIREAQENWDAAADAYGKAQALNPRAPLTSRRAVALLSAGRPAEARDAVQASLDAKRTEGNESILLYLLAESQRVLKDLPAARATAEKLLTANPHDSRGLHVLSLIQQDQGDMKAAEKTLRGILERDPLDANALNSLGYMYAERGERLDEAIVLLQRALKVEPGNASYLDSLGWAYFQQGNLELADPPLTEAASKLLESSVVQDHLGDLRYKQRRFNDAIAAWERALEGDGQSIDRAAIEKKLREARGRQ